MNNSKKFTRTNEQVRQATKRFNTKNCIWKKEQAKMRYFEKWKLTKEQIEILFEAEFF